MEIQIKINLVTYHPICTIQFKDKPYFTKLSDGSMMFGKAKISLYRKEKFYIKYGQKFYSCKLSGTPGTLIITSSNPVNVSLSDEHLVSLPVNPYTLV